MNVKQNSKVTDVFPKHISTSLILPAKGKPQREIFAQL